MKKIKVMTVVGTRPEIIRLSRVIAELDEQTEHILVHTGQNYDYELNGIFFKELGIRKPDYFLGAAGGSAGETVGKIISEADKVLAKENPDAFLVLGDTNSCLAAYVAKRRKIPIFHMEAGNRCFDERVPEEINRKIIDHISDINLTYGDLARQNLLREGLPPAQIIKTGSPMFEVLEFYKKKINASKILKSLKLKNGEYLVASMHREETIDSDKNFARAIGMLNGVAKFYKKTIVFSAHPRTRKMIELKGIKFEKNIKMLKPLGFLDYAFLQKNAFCVLTDSGTISEESSILKFPAVNLRDAHERPEAMDEASVIMAGIDLDSVLRAIEAATNRKSGDYRDVEEYGYPNVSKKVLRIILSYIGYVNKNIWRKS